MTEVEFAKSLVQDAEDYFDISGSPVPSLITDKSNLKKYDLELLKEELSKLNYNFCELEKSPEPFCLMPLKNKMLIYKN